jgi:hypothetical protein
MKGNFAVKDCTSIEDRKCDKRGFAFGVGIKIIIISNLSNNRSKASSKTIPPHSAI